jgi:hypothetical protein
VGFGDAIRERESGRCYFGRFSLPEAEHPKSPLKAINAGSRWREAVSPFGAAGTIMECSRLACNRKIAKERKKIRSLASAAGRWFGDSSLNEPAPGFLARQFLNHTRRHNLYQLLLSGLE